MPRPSRYLWKGAWTLDSDTPESCNLSEPVFSHLTNGNRKHSINPSFHSPLPSVSLTGTSVIPLRTQTSSSFSHTLCGYPGYELTVVSFEGTQFDIPQGRQGQTQDFRVTRWQMAPFSGLALRSRGNSTLILGIPIP